MLWISISGVHICGYKRQKKNPLIEPSSLTESLKAEARIVEARKHLDFFYYFCLFSICFRFQTFHDILSQKDKKRKKYGVEIFFSTTNF